MDEIEIQKGSEPTDIIHTCWFKWGCTLKMVSEIFTIKSIFYGPFNSCAVFSILQRTFYLPKNWHDLYISELGVCGQMTSYCRACTCFK